MILSNYFHAFPTQKSPEATWGAGLQADAQVESSTVSSISTMSGDDDKRWRAGEPGGPEKMQRTGKCMEIVG